MLMLVKSLKKVNKGKLHVNRNVERKRGNTGIMCEICIIEQGFFFYLRLLLRNFLACKRQTGHD